MRASAVVLELALLAVVLAGALRLYSLHADFPLGLHPDEKRKARAARDAAPEFFHPHALYHATRLAASAAGARSLQEIAEAGRAASAWFGVGLVAASFALFRRGLARPTALAATAVVAATPILAVHAHYLKEDVCFAFATTLALVALVAFERTRSRRALVALGLATGFAIASKYTGVVLFAVYAAIPLAAEVRDRRAWYRTLGAVAALALGVFAGVDAALFAERAAFVAGFAHELRHALRGHDFAIGAPGQLFAFHLRQSLVPGVGVGVTGAALAGAAYAARRGAPAIDRVLAVAFAGFYLAIELAPIKPFPDFMRYALPLAPLAVYFAARAADVLAARVAPRAAWAAAALLLALGTPAALRAARLVAALGDDTRFAAGARVRALPGPVVADDYSVAWRNAPHPDLAGPPLFDRSDTDLASARWAVTSSFRWERFHYGEDLAPADARVQRAAAGYRALFACPYEEIRAPEGPFAFSNPTIRIVDLARCAPR